MARKKERSIYVTKQPEWNKLRLITDPVEQLVAFRSCEYFVRTEIPKKKLVTVAKRWVKDKSGWTPEEIKNVLGCPDWSFSSAGISLFIESKLVSTEEKFMCFESFIVPWFNSELSLTSRIKASLLIKKTASCGVIFLNF